MTARQLPQPDLCPNCDAAIANRRGIYSCGYCGLQFERAPDSEIVARDGTVRVCRIWYRINSAERELEARGGV